MATITFGVNTSQEVKEYANGILEIYKEEGETNQDALLKIMKLAEHEKVRGTHPNLEKSLRSIDGTIDTLIKQINGIVAGQDRDIAELNEKLNTAIGEKHAAIDNAQKVYDEANKKAEEADKTIEKASQDIEKTKADAESKIKQANDERDHAILECAQVREISETTKENNELLISKMKAMEDDINSYEKLKLDFEKLSEDYASAKAEISTLKLQNELNVEKAVIAKEREYQERLRESDKEKSLLEAQIMQLKAQLEK